ncbi:cupin domain-containing protein [Epidermidibacterium keratini]|uniref:Cupin domain-containing protein n=1 Tax=Epidermidibacterium keratini TaxID=1891644 RepID=A0A7L4YN45_9ACTN|nr:cupin domain-containing protein [Epidermidibacterium keratini]QHC00498.1 cupin domain-containing protein [Epidermidibacterium keratini]
MKTIRRIVTGTRDGKAVIASDEQVPEIRPDLGGGITTVPLWGAVEPPTFPSDGSPTPFPRFSPNPGGFHFSVFSIPTVTEQEQLTFPEDLDAAAAEMEREVPGLLELMEPDTPGMHRTRSIDFIVILSGEVTLDLGDGATAVLHAGDTVVQNATRHRWINTGTERAWAAAVVLGAECTD